MIRKASADVGLPRPLRTLSVARHCHRVAVDLAAAPFSSNTLRSGKAIAILKNPLDSRVFFRDFRNEITVFLWDFLPRRQLPIENNSNREENGRGRSHHRGESQQSLSTDNAFRRRAIAIRHHQISSISCNLRVTLETKIISISQLP